MMRSLMEMSMCTGRCIESCDREEYYRRASKVSEVGGDLVATEGLGCSHEEFLTKERAGWRSRSLCNKHVLRSMM